jgi:erythromycin esterase-like protein
MFRLAFNQGEFRAVLLPTGGPAQGVQAHRIEKAASETFEAALTRTGLAMLALDLRSAPTDGTVAVYLRRAIQMREIGAAYTPDYHYLVYLRPRLAFDGVLFVESTTASRPNPPLPP